MSNPASSISLPINFLPAHVVAAGLSSGEYTHIMIANHCRRQVGRVEPHVNATIATRDPIWFDGQALKHARLLKKDPSRLERMPFLGLPAGVKGSLPVEGLPDSKGGVRGRWRSKVSPVSAPMVEMMERAGLIISHITNLPPMSMGFRTQNRKYGPTRNPWNLAHSVGGSSGGSAALVAYGGAHIASGASILGSGPLPASFCGVYAHTLSPYLLPLDGHTPDPTEVKHLPTTVFYSRSARDLQILFEHMSGQEGFPAREETRLTEVTEKAPGETRIAFASEFGDLQADAQVSAAINAFVGKLKGEGYDVEEIRLEDHGIDPDKLWHTCGALFGTQVRNSMPRPLRFLFRTLKLNGHAKRGVSFYRGISDGFAGKRTAKALHERALSDLEDLLAARDGLFERFDAMILPGAMTTPPPQAKLLSDVAVDGRNLSCAAALGGFAMIHNALKLADVSIPIGLSETGLPIGVQLLGQQNNDRNMLRLAIAIERDILGPWQRPQLYFAGIR